MNTKQYWQILRSTPQGWTIVRARIDDSNVAQNEFDACVAEQPKSVFALNEITITTLKVSQPK